MSLTSQRRPFFSETTAAEKVWAVLSIPRTLRSPVKSFSGSDWRVLIKLFSSEANSPHHPDRLPVTAPRLSLLRMF